MNYIVFDLEATCWEGAPPNQVREIIEIGAIKLNAFGEPLGSFNQFIRPVVNPILSPYCKELTGIEQNQVQRAAKFTRVIDLFFEWSDLFEEPYLLLSWGKMDVTLLQNDCALHEVDADWLQTYIDMKSQYKSIRKLRKPIGLKKALTREGFEFDGQHHRAIDDATNTVKLFLKYFDEWQF